MVTSCIQLFVFLMKLFFFFSGQEKVSCDVTVLAADTCAIKGQYYSEGTSRAVTPTCAGREGINSGNLVMLRFDDNSLKDKGSDKFNITFGFKFFMKLPQLTGREQVWAYSGFGLYAIPNGSLELVYAKMRNGKVLPVNYLLEIPASDVGNFNQCGLENEDQSEGSDSDWIQLIGMKLKVPERKKREIQKDNRWMLIGFDFDRHPGGHFNIYINGKMVHNLNFSETYYAMLTGYEMGFLMLYKAKFSCIEFSKGKTGATYFTDPRLSECMKAYEEEPEKKYEDCEKDL